MRRSLRLADILGEDAGKQTRGVRAAPEGLRRYVMNLRSERLVETMFADGNFEFPAIAPRGAGTSHQRI